MLSMPNIKPQVYFNFNRRFLPSSASSIENKPMMHIGHKIKAAIKAKGITQMALAEVVGVSNNAVTKWVRTGKVSKKNIPKVAKALGMPTTDFLDGQPDEDLARALRILQDPKLRALFFAAEPLAEYQKDFLIQKSIEIKEQPKQNHNGTQ